MRWPWQRDEPEQIHRELFELIIKAGRRCAHDLEHAATDVLLASSDRKKASDLWHERAKMWQKIFYADGGPKDYRHRLHSDIFILEEKVRALRKQLLTAGIEPCIDDGDIPF